MMYFGSEYRSIMESFNSVFTTIEFDENGVITNVNDNFLRFLDIASQKLLEIIILCL